MYCTVHYIPNPNNSVQSCHHPHFTDEETEAQRCQVSSQHHTAREWQGQDLNAHLPGSKSVGKEKLGRDFQGSIMKPEPAGVQLLELGPQNHSRSPGRYCSGSLTCSPLGPRETLWGFSPSLRLSQAHPRPEWPADPLGAVSRVPTPQFLTRPPPL